MSRLGVAAALVAGALLPGDVAVDDGRVTAVGLPPAAGGAIAAPGLVDAQCNGYAGVDLAAVDPVSADPDADGGHGPDATDPGPVLALTRAAARDGVTALVPTLITAPPDATVAALHRLDAARPHTGRTGAARLLGAHLEGPFLAPTRLGTHPAAHRRDPDAELLADLLAAGRVDVVTLAPELAGAPDLVSGLVARGVVVSCGHSDADAGAVHAAYDRGATGATHLFNAMSGVDHRRPGLAAVALTRPGVVVGVIADGHHLAPETLRLVAAAAPGRFALITDATAAAGMPDGRHVLGGVDVTLADGAVRNDDGTLAGSAATLAGCVRVAVEAGVDPAAALTAATATPARLLRRPDLGTLAPGARADVCVLDQHLHVDRVLLGGTEVAR